MRRRRTRSFTVLAAAAAIAGSVALPASPASAVGEQLSATPSSNLLNGDTIQVALSAASAYNGQTVYFAECGVPGPVTYSGETAYCGTFQPQGGVAVTNGAATGAVTAVTGAVGNGASCTAANNGGCTVAAFAVGGGGPTRIASAPITFAAPQGTALSATPSTNLDDGDAVAVSLTGVPNGVSTVDIRQCHGDVPFTYAQTSNCRYVLSGVAVTNHAYSGSMNVRYGPVFAGNTSGPRCDETASGHCVIAALDTTNQTVLAATAISFEAPPIGLTVTPDTGLKDNQAVTVTATGIPSSAGSLDLRECNTTYAASIGQATFSQTLAACGFDLGGLNDGFVDLSHPRTVTVDDGPSSDGKTACNYATNGQCALVVFGYGPNAAGQYGYNVVQSHPITFRPPVLGPPTIAATPTTGLHDGAEGTLSVAAGNIPDGVDGVSLVECRPEAIQQYTGDWVYRACAQLTSFVVADNTFAPRKFRYHEGGTGGTGVKPCDHTHPCGIALVATTEDGTDYVLGNWIPISFRDPNFGTPKLTLSKTRGLQQGDNVTLTVTDVPDLIRATPILECNIKGGYDRERCVGLKVKPGDLGTPIAHDNKVQGATTIKVGAVGISNSGKRVFCNAKTNGQCVLVAIAYPGYKYLVQSSVIKFGP